MLLIFRFLLFISILTIFNSCSTYMEKEYKKIYIETPSCDISECRLRYEDTNDINTVIPPGFVTVEDRESDLYIACYTLKKSGSIQSIIVNSSFNRIKHPLACNAPKVKNMELEITVDVEDDVVLNISQEATSGSDYQINVTQQIIETDDQLLQDQKKEAIENAKLEEKRKQLIKPLMDQIDLLYKQGLISKEKYESEKLVIQNMKL